MNLSFAEKILYDGAIKSNKRFMTILSLSAQILSLLCSILFFCLFLIKPYERIFFGAIIFLLATLMFFLIYQYQSLIRKLDKR